MKITSKADHFPLNVCFSFPFTFIRSEMLLVLILYSPDKVNLPIIECIRSTQVPFYTGFTVLLADLSTD
jgi:hypothetical protein